MVPSYRKVGVWRSSSGLSPVEGPTWHDYWGVRRSEGKCQKPVVRRTGSPSTRTRPCGVETQIADPQRGNKPEIPPVLGDFPFPRTFWDFRVPTFLLPHLVPTSFAPNPPSPDSPMFSGLSRELLLYFSPRFITFHHASLRFTACHCFSLLLLLESLKKQ